ncbi:MAG: flagellar FlbD family protein [Candidatus Fervidibacter sp.]|uniref:flagellar FlbD family protein n=1 Tax=Candidatus Fervidibacter sp. TaxID=3100871 RepID=UPI00404A1D08
MVLVHRLDGAPFYLNAELVETVEATPDTVIVLVNGHRYIVREQVEEVIARILNYRRFLFTGVSPSMVDSMLRER